MEDTKGDGELVIERTLELKAPVERVWRAISDEKELASWFPDEAEFEAKEGSRGRFGWKEHGEGTVVVVDVDPPHRLSWRWQSSMERSYEEYSTLVEWTLTAREDGGTTLHLRESGFDNAKHHEQNSGGWKEELGRLVEYLAKAGIT